MPAADAPENRMRLLFLARRYPPSVGGIQTHCHKLYSRLSRQYPVTLVALGRDSLLHLAWFLPWVAVRTLAALVFRRVDAVYFADGVVCALAPVLRPFKGRARFVVTIYGLEMTYRSALARGLMKSGCRCCERIVLISEHTRNLALAWGLPPERLRVVYVGVEPAEPAAQRCAELRAEFEERTGVAFASEKVLLNIGRQVRRKGMVPFVEQGLPLLESDIRLIIAGGGPDMPRLRELASRPETASRILIVDAPDDDAAAMLRRSAGLFVMPNVPMADDVEGYGITPLESMHSETPVVAFAVDALVESIREGGWLVPAGDYSAFAGRIHEFFSLGEPRRAELGREARQYVLREYGWDKSAREYAAIFAGDSP